MKILYFMDCWVTGLSQSYIPGLVSITFDMAVCHLPPINRPLCEETMINHLILRISRRYWMIVSSVPILVKRSFR